MDNGTVYQYLRKQENSLSYQQIIKFATQITAGMIHLHSGKSIISVGGFSNVTFRGNYSP